VAVITASVAARSQSAQSFPLLSADAAAGNPGYYRANES